MTTALNDASDFAFEEFVHQFQWHPIGVAEQIAGTGNKGSASCSCGGWSTHVLDNRAGRQDADEAYAAHVNAERRERVEEIAVLLLDVDLAQHPIDIQTTLAAASAALREANVY